MATASRKYRHHLCCGGEWGGGREGGRRGGEKERPRILFFLQNPDKEEVTDVVSFYHLPSTIVKHPIHRTLYVAYSFYNVALATPLKDLMLDALVIAKKVSSCSV